MSEFLYVYVVFYLSPSEKVYERENEFGMMICASLRRAIDVIEGKTGSRAVDTIHEAYMWRSGNYWIERQAIIDSYSEGLEYGNDDPPNRWPLPQ